MINTTPSDFRLQTSYFKPQTSDLILQTSDFRPQTSDFILVKDYVVAAYLSDRLFLAKQHLNKDFLQRFLALAQPKNIRINSV